MTFIGTVTTMGFGGGMVAIESEKGRIGQMVAQAHKGKTGAIVKKSAYGYEVVFDDGDFSDHQQFDALSPFCRIKETNLPDMSPEQIAVLIAKKIEAQEQSRAADKLQRERRAERYNHFLKQYEEEYKDFDKSEKSRIRAAKNIRRELGQAFPHVKFSVKSDITSIDISWIDGVSCEDVKAIAGKYEQCGVDGMQDLKTYDRDAQREALRAVIGKIDFVFERREISDAFREKVHRAIYQRHNLEYPEGVALWEQKIDNEYVSHQYSNDICGRTSFMPGEEFAGLEIVNGRYEVQKTVSTDYLNSQLKAFTDEKTREAMTPGEAAGKSFSRNPALNGIEIKFANHFGDEIRRALWEQGFRWHKAKKLYYAKETPERLAFVQGL